MKRRTLIKDTMWGAAAIATISPLAAALPDAKPEYMVGENHLGQHILSDDVKDFLINIDRRNKLIDVRPLHKDKPHLTVLAFHRYIQEMQDSAAISDSSHVVDITDGIITQRATDVQLYVINDWRLTGEARETLVGGIVERPKQGFENSSFCVELLGQADYNLTRNIRIVCEGGGVYPYNYTGYFRINEDDMSMHGGLGITLEYEAYKNMHCVYDKRTRDAEFQYGVWVSESYSATLTHGIIPVPILSMG